MEQTDTPKKKHRKGIARVVLEWMEELVIAVVIIAVIFTFFFRVITVTGTSMVPNYNDGDRVLVTTAKGLRQGDVVVITNVLDEPIIKRIIATEGQLVDFDYANGVVYVDDEAVDETEFGLSNGITKEPYTSFELLTFPQRVPEGCVFVLGDNRAVSEDSRYQIVGMVDRRNILGKALFHLFPFGD